MVSNRLSRIPYSSRLSTPFHRRRFYIFPVYSLYYSTYVCEISCEWRMKVICLSMDLLYSNSSIVLGGKENKVWRLWIVAFDAMINFSRGKWSVSRSQRRFLRDVLDGGVQFFCVEAKRLRSVRKIDTFLLASNVFVNISARNIATRRKSIPCSDRQTYPASYKLLTQVKSIRMSSSYVNLLRIIIGYTDDLTYDQSNRTVVKLHNFTRFDDIKLWQSSTCGISIWSLRVGENDYINVSVRNWLVLHWGKPWVNQLTFFPFFVSMRNNLFCIKNINKSCI